MNNFKLRSLIHSFDLDWDNPRSWT